MKPYDIKPRRLLAQLTLGGTSDFSSASYCAGFECKAWRCDALADHLLDWIADYALKEDELIVNHGNMYVRLKEAAARVYTSKNYEERGEIGEIVLHAICREYFGTIPFAPRVFYLSSTNDVVKSFDMAHVRYIDNRFQLWLGEAKFYRDGKSAIQAAISSVRSHIKVDFLKGQKLILGPQVSKSLPKYDEIRNVFSYQNSIDDLFNNSVFPVCIVCDSDAIKESESICSEYIEKIKTELDGLCKIIEKAGLHKNIKIFLIYVPLGSKLKLAAAFDRRLKALSP
ncbi:DUF1837 domain-containing protein [Nitrospirillum sp. BR 11164]|uniref:HamA C-terminal domain-containing protein n=1 Tax=Nitrospirillum sp. BR 11164 TaxID=3104324 RepID=UPI002AFF1C18|nr:DUF1837 domain-containing protein [Nitrospirillum sp. BR 11164]MEA1647791.1 DUF1837 domain-containing protein [Nitrospirillum sp. BR 11164]